MGEPHGASALLRLRLSEDVAGAFARERPSHPYGGVLQINVRPLEAEQLTTPHASIDGEHVEGFKPVSLRRLKQLAGFGSRERVLLFWRGRGGLHAVCGVARDAVPLDLVG